MLEDEAARALNHENTGDLVTTTVVVTNRKGGSGKSATAVNLAACAAASRRTLLVDLDIQGDASVRLGLDGSGEELADALAGRTSLESAIRPTAFGVDVAVAGEVLDYLTGSVHPDALSRCLAPIRSRYDLIVIDCPPGLNNLVLAGWRAAASLLALVPVDGAEALRVVPRLRVAWSDAGRDPAELRLLVTRWDGRRRLDGDVLCQARETYGSAVLDSRIRETIVVAESAAYRIPLLHYAPKHPVTADHIALTEEVICG